MKTTNAKSRQFVQNRLPFIANNLKGVVEGNFYIVYSYGWYPLFAYYSDTNTWFENSERYSVSTSKQRGQCHPQTDTLTISHDDLKQFISLRKVG
jgi:hypothetical protein